MALVSLNCPNCGGSLKMEDTMDKGFCMYCGSSFLVKDEIQRVQVEHSGNVNLNLNREKEVTNLLIRAEDRANALLNNKSISTTDFSQVCLEINERYTEKILDIDARNQRAIELREKLANENNKRVEYESKCIAEKNEKFAEVLRIEKLKIDARNERDFFLDKRLVPILLIIALVLFLVFVFAVVA